MISSSSHHCVLTGNLPAKSIEGLPLALESIDNIHRSDCLPASMLGVGHRVTDDILKEDLEHAASLLIDETGDALDTSTAGEAADGGLGNALDVIAKYLAMTLRAPLPESFASFSASRHDELVVGTWDEMCFRRGENVFMY